MSGQDPKSPLRLFPFSHELSKINEELEIIINRRKLVIAITVLRTQAMGKSQILAALVDLLTKVDSCVKESDFRTIYAQLNSLAELLSKKRK